MRFTNKNNSYFLFKRLIDLVFAIILLIIFSPLFFLVSLVILVSDGRPIFFVQERIGKKWSHFKILKFRTMYKSTPKFAIGNAVQNDFIKYGGFLRKYRLDELPQLINIIKNDMSFVGPRPEIAKFARKYDSVSRNIFCYKPGITSFASLEFSNESERLSGIKDQEKYYLNKIVPEKISIDLKYFKKESFFGDWSIVWMTVKKLWG